MAQLASSGPRVPTWAQVNQAKDECLNYGKGHFDALKAAWSLRSVQVWNPFAAPVSPEVLVARTVRSGKSAAYDPVHLLIWRCMQSQPTTLLLMSKKYKMSMTPLGLLAVERKITLFQLEMLGCSSCHTLIFGVW